MERNGRQHGGTCVPATEVWFELRRVASSEPFLRSPKLRTFLCFVVEETMAGRGARLTEYVLGVEIFGRHATYDPRLDSRVRVEAHRLRAALAAYYRQQGRDDAVIIRLDQGSYSPSFSFRISSDTEPSWTPRKEEVS
jgi:hypothetical protein